MSKYIDSFEVEALKKLIASKEQYLQKTTGAQFQILQREIMFLKIDILPIIQRNTNIIHSEFGKYAISGYDTALQYKCNGFIIYQPIDENYTNTPIVGILNTRQLQPFGTFGAIELDIINMDNNGAKVRPINLPLNLLL